MSESREEWILERAAIREYMGRQCRYDAEQGAIRDWELWCQAYGLDVETGMPLGATETAQGSVR